MVIEPKVNLTITINDTNLDLEQQEEEVYNLLEQMRNWEEIEKVSRISDSNTPDGSKALGGFLVGMLMAEVKPKNLINLLRALSSRLLSKTIEIEVEANGKKLKVKANNQEELSLAIKEAQKFISE